MNAQSKKRLWILLAALIGIGVSLWLVSSLLRERLPQSQSVAQQDDLYPSAKVYRKGSLNGIPIAVRGDYLGHPITYTDKSDWEPASSPDYYQKKTYADDMVGFDVVVHWPSMQPHRPSNHSSWLTYRSFKPTEWISISAIGDLKAYQKAPVPVVNRLARNINNDIKRVVDSPYKRIESDGKEVLTDLRYELHGPDQALGLQVAKTVGRDADRPGGGNFTLYWIGDLNTIVETSIRCPAGILRDLTSVHTCTHQFELPELGSFVAVDYTENLLPQWRQIEARAREFVLSLRVDPKNSSIR
ncbi:hypothetical protein [Methylibium sp.]|uniref:hypothetical protein n=1 Tax=Methylibium sp. TaxID=2067992 RepID=UPI003D09F7FE